MRSSIPSADYHSALKEPLEVPPAWWSDQWDSAGCLAFVHDLMAAPTLPAHYDRCDVLVTDLPWQTGFGKFNLRAGVKAQGRTYVKFLARIGEIVDATRVPLYLVTGKHALPRLPAPGVVLPTNLNGDEAVIIGYRPGVEADGRYPIAQEFLHTLGQSYSVAGDFCCGYGRTGRFFLRAGKRAVLSDFNAQCIGYVAQHAAEWRG